jgi:hypothetical protein
MFDWITYARCVDGVACSSTPITPVLDMNTVTALTTTAALW